MRAAVFVLGLLLLFGSAVAYDGLTLYTAVITKSDRHNSKGNRLKSVRAVLRQDRANYCWRQRNNLSRGDADYFCVAHRRNMFDSAKLRIHPRLADRIVYGRRSVTVCVFVLTHRLIEVIPGRCRDV